MKRVAVLGWMLGVLVVFGFLDADPALARSRTRMYDPLNDEILMVGERNQGPSFDLSLLPGNFLQLLSPLQKPVDLESVSEKYFDQKLNPSDPSDGRTFRQRYYIYSGYAQGPGAPVVLYIGGEAELRAQSFMGRFADKTAETLHAHIVAIEHRYYGKSQPFIELSAENLQYLSTENALADLASLQGHLMLHEGLQGKWVAMGGSYPGALSAFYRLKYPELVVGALASSAPVQAKNAFEEYDSHVTSVVGPVCADLLRQVVAAAEKAIDAGPEAAAEFKAKFGADDVVNDVDFLYVLADITADAVQYGYPEKLCSELAPAPNPVTAYAQYVRQFLADRGETAADFSPASAAKLSAVDSDNMRQWTYQSCREFGFWQDGHHDRSRSVRSARINAQYDRESCQRFFGLSDIADESAINSRFYAPLRDPSQASRILFTNGSDDPWSELSITRLRGNDTNPNTTAVLIQNKAHCSDLRAVRADDSESLRSARQLFLDLASSWVR